VNTQSLFNDDIKGIEY